MKLTERIFQAVLFETLLVVLSTAVLVWLTEHEVGETGALLVVISLIALLWNMLFNWLFDRVFTAPRHMRGWGVRSLHAVLFEGGLLLFTLPLMMWWLAIGFWPALMMDIGLTAMVLVYTVVFHYVYDHCRAKWFQAA